MALTLVIKSNASQATDVLLADVGIYVPSSGSSITFSDPEAINQLRESARLRAYMVDDAFGAGSSTLILNDGTSDIAQADRDQFLDNVLVDSTTGAFRVLQTNASDQIDKSITFNGTATLTGAKLGGNLDANSQRITNLATPTVDTDAATKSYVDAVAQGLDLKGSVRTKSTADVASLSGDPGTINGVGSWSTGQRLLLTNQTTTTQNGIWVVSTTGAWTRATDMAVGSSAAGAFVFIEQGSSGADTGWVCTNDAGTDVVGTDGLAFSQFSGTSVDFGASGDMASPGLGSANAGGISSKVARADHVHTHGDRGGDGTTSQHDADQVDVEATLSIIGAPGTVEAVMSNINGLFDGGRKAGKLLGFGMTSSVPDSGIRYYGSAGVAVGIRIIRAGRITAAGLQVDQVDASRAYKLSIKINGSEVASVALSTSTLGNQSTALSVTCAQGDLLSCSLERTSGSGTSTFNNSHASVEFINT